MAKQLVAVFLMCVVVFAAVHVDKAEASDDLYKECYNACFKECFDGTNGYTFCEMKCDTDCGVKVLQAKIDEFKNKP